MRRHSCVHVAVSVRRMRSERKHKARQSVSHSIFRLHTIFMCFHFRLHKIFIFFRLHTIFVSMECALFCLFVIAVSCDQFQAIISDETAIEQIQRRGSARTDQAPKMLLLREVFGSGPIIFWFLPCQNSPAKRDYVRVASHYPV